MIVGSVKRLVASSLRDPLTAVLVLCGATLVKVGLAPVPDLALEAAVSRDPRVFNPEWAYYTWLWNSPFNKIVAFVVGFGGDERMFLVASGLLLSLGLGLVIGLCLWHPEQRILRLAGIAGVFLGPLLSSQLVWLGKSDVPAIIAGFCLAFGVAPVGLLISSFVGGFNHFEVAVLQAIIFAVLPARRDRATRKTRELAIFSAGVLGGRVALHLWNSEFDISPWSRADWVVTYIENHVWNLLANPFVWLFSLLGVGWLPLILLVASADARSRYRLLAAVLFVIAACSVVADSSRIASLISIPLLCFVGSECLTGATLSESRKRDVLVLGILCPPVVWWGGSAVVTGWPYVGKLLGL